MTNGPWVGDHRNSVAFELAALDKIHIWTRAVTPVLVVRCENGHAESFVFTQSAARMETQDGDHTVRVAFDGGRGRDRALARFRRPRRARCAPDGPAFAQQLAQSALAAVRVRAAQRAAGHARLSRSAGSASCCEDRPRQCGWKN